jgi:hypothetical protein
MALGFTGVLGRGRLRALGVVRTFRLPHPFALNLQTTGCMICGARGRKGELREIFIQGLVVGQLDRRFACLECWGEIAAAYAEMGWIPAEVWEGHSYKRVGSF